MRTQHILVVAAHPDDEALGCGGTMARHVAAGDIVHVLFLADGVGARHDEAPVAEFEERDRAAAAAMADLGAQPAHKLDLPDNRLDTVALLDVVRGVEDIVNEVRPRIIYTHHAGDLNIDHRIAHQAVMTACRPLPGSTFEAVYAFEVPSSTEWAGPSYDGAFRPTHFVEITAQLDAKRKALGHYAAEMRPSPHPRSLETVESLARLRGSTIGVPAAEAFMVLWQIHRSD